MRLAYGVRRMTTHKMLANIILEKIKPHIEKIRMDSEMEDL